MKSQTSVLEIQAQLWKARAQKKQKRLELSLAQPAGSPEEAAWRVAWIKRGLRTVKRAQAALKYQAALVDAYAQHLSVLEMTLLAAGEKKRTGAEEKETRSPETQHV